eukprot:4400323-Pleurochrysis_carterae.AAC.2
MQYTHCRHLLQPAHRARAGTDGYRWRSLRAKAARSRSLSVSLRQCASTGVPAAQSCRLRSRVHGKCNPENLRFKRQALFTNRKGPKGLSLIWHLECLFDD